MKKVFLLGSLVLLAAISSCTIKEEIAEETPDRTFWGSLEQEDTPDTRAYVTSGLKIYWNRGDHVSIFYDKTFNREFEYKGRDGTTAGEFNRFGSDPAHFTEVEIESGYDYAIYPYDYDNGCDYDGTLTVAFPVERKYTPGKNGIGATPVLVARDTDGDFLFKHAAGYLGFQLYGQDVTVASVKFEGNNNELIAGYPLVAFSDEGDPIVAFNLDAPDNETSITLLCDPPIALNGTSEECKEFWVAIPPVAFTKGFTMKVTTADGGVFEYNYQKAFTLARKKFTRVVPLEVVPVITVSGVTVSPTRLEMNVGDQQTLTATVSPDSAPNKSILWSSSNSAVASVDENGGVTAISAGRAVITATTEEGGKTAACSVTVKNEISYSLTLSPAEAEIDFGQTQTYIAKLTTTTNGVDSESEVSASLTSSAPAVAKVEGSTVTGLAGGSATITATYTPEGSSNALTAQAAITVKDVYSYGLAITPANAEINAGETQAYTIVLTTTKNGSVSSTQEISTAVLSSSDESVATVSGNIATGVAGGTATITATYTPEGASEAVTATSSLKVNDIVTYSLALDPSEDATVIIGKTLALTLTLTVTTNGVSADSTVNTDATWTSSDGSLVTIDGGNVTGVKEGKLTITAKYTPEGSDELTATVELTVNKEPNHAGDPVEIEEGDF
ncbi:MAG: Ig-like domain-containing protein [Bacteroidales bacterium]|nr:Ig-like domain-containing protein [Bacteroidales bacterium]